MEEKKLKTPVFAMETVFNDSAEIPIDIDFTLPDYCPDVTKILKCRAVSRIVSKSAGGRSVTVDGCVTITVMYADADARLCSYEYQYPFSKIFETGTDTDGTVLRVRTRTEYINCRAVTGRKIDIHGAAGVFVTLCKRKCTEVISDIDDKNIELLRGSAPATSPMGMSEKYIIIEEDIEIGQGQPAIQSVLRYDATAAVKECKLLNNKVMVKGELVLKILYCPENGIPQMITDTEPFSQLVEVDGVTDSCECDASASVANIELKPRISAAGEARSFTLNAKLLLCCECYCNNDIDLVLDAFSRQYNADIVRNDICFNKIVRNINESFSCKKSVTVPDENITSVSDMWCEVKTEGVKCEGNELVISGTVTASFIVNGSDGEPSYFEKPIEFEYRTQNDVPPDCLKCEPHFSVMSSGYTMTGAGNVEIRVELSVNAAVYRCSNVSLITDVTIDENSPVTKSDRGAMTIYFASDGENVWDIARHYLASVADIKQINDIEENILESGKMVLIPMN